MRVNELISERASDDIVSSIAGGWKKGRDLNFTDKPTDGASPKKQLSNQAGTADIKVNRYQLTDLKYAMDYLSNDFEETKSLLIRLSHHLDNTEKIYNEILVP